MPTLITAIVAFASIFFVESQKIEEKFYEQKLDHINGNRTFDTWQQRYLQNNQFYKPGGPIFLYVGGPKNFPIYPEGIQKGAIVTYAMEQGANLIALESRYYGQSRPTADISTENLSKYLNFAQIIADIAAFANWIKTQPEFLTSKVVGFGTGFGGSRIISVMKTFPGVIDIAVASSSAVEVKYEFPEYSAAAVEIVNKMNPECFESVHDSLLCFGKIIKGETCQGHNLADLKNFLNLCGDLDSQNPFDAHGLLVAVLKAVSGVILTNNPDPNFPYNIEKMCQSLDETSNMTRVEKVANEIKKILFLANQPCLEARFDKTVEYLQSPSWNASASISGERQAFWLRCSQGALIRTPQALGLPDGGKFAVDYTTELCKRLFNISADQVKMNTEKVDETYGRRKPPMPQCVIYVSGSNDLFKSLQITTAAEAGTCNRAIVIEGAAFAKNVGEGMSYPQSLRTAQFEIGAVIADWLNTRNCCGPSVEPLLFEAPPQHIYYPTTNLIHPYLYTYLQPPQPFHFLPYLNKPYFF